MVRRRQNNKRTPAKSAKRAMTMATVAAASLAHAAAGDGSVHAQDLAAAATRADEEKDIAYAAVDAPLSADEPPREYNDERRSSQLIEIVSNSTSDPNDEDSATTTLYALDVVSAEDSPPTDQSGGQQQLIEITSSSNSTDESLSTTEQRSLQSQMKKLATTYQTDGTFAGHMFNIKANKRVILRTMELNIFKPSVGIQIYVKRGNFKGHEKNPNQWTLWVQTTIEGAGANKVTRVPMSKFPRMTIESGEMRSFYVTCPSGACMRYKNEGFKRYGNTELTYYGNGAAKMKGWQGNHLSPRTFSGGMVYEVAAPKNPEPEVGFLLGFGPVPTPPPTPPPTRKAERPGGDFRLRLYWKRGYRWQESSREMFWCMKCSGSCRDGSSIYLDWCGSSSRQKFVAVGDTIRPDRDKDLCLTVTGTNEEKPLRAEDCKSGDADQKFSGLDKNGPFELKPKKYGSARCVTQQHHPKKYERVFPQECSEAKAHETHMWEVW